MRAPKVRVLLWTVALLTACPSPPDPLPVGTLSVSPNAQTVPAGGAKATFSATLTGTDAPSAPPVPRLDEPPEADRPRSEGSAEIAEVEPSKE